ncbi:MAG: single-stranded DNA-binding protein [Clostridiales bacterium]|jgi:single-strand DNA-binding protein|nr:single-stranded DNA-binding protein [Clostridiales bacterium]
MFNRVLLIGRLTRDPEIRHIPTGVAVTTFTLAVNRNFTNQQGEREADFIPIVVWRGLAETCARYLSKGRLVAVSGRIQTRSYERDGQRRYVTEVIGDEVVFLDRDGSAGARSPASMPEYQPIGQEADFNVPFEPIEGEDDELPF